MSEKRSIFSRLGGRIISLYLVALTITTLTNIAMKIVYKETNYESPVLKEFFDDNAHASPSGP